MALVVVVGTQAGSGQILLPLGSSEQGWGALLAPGGTQHVTGLSLFLRFRFLSLFDHVFVFIFLSLLNSFCPPLFFLSLIFPSLFPFPFTPLLFHLCTLPFILH